MPSRIQRRRTRGWRALEGAVYVGRGTRWGNPYVVVQTRTGTGWAVHWAGHRGQTPPHGLKTEVPANHQRDAHALAVELHAVWFFSQPELVDRAQRELAGRDLMCWCHESLPCHADVLLRIANKEA
ncbi:DUF4326 domain-containing protein [Streptomyces sp. Ac-502]|uniref:DUF4326 domain-containing protein n=1 Tax=Streptomyces sp. Ac-502 TaxID=3342801 RepID=UPI0038627B92